MGLGVDRIAGLLRRPFMHYWKLVWYTVLHLPRLHGIPLYLHAPPLLAHRDAHNVYEQCERASGHLLRQILPPKSRALLLLFNITCDHASVRVCADCLGSFLRWHPITTPQHNLQHNPFLRNRSRLYILGVLWHPDLRRHDQDPYIRRQPPIRHRCNPPDRTYELHTNAV